jgi:hypothetical protein
MALVRCPECGANISQHAASCPHCGYPISDPIAPPQDSLESLAAANRLSYAAAPRRVTRPRTQTIEATGKVWKAQILLASLMAVGGIIAAMVGDNAGKQGEAAGLLGRLAVVFGILWFIFARIGAWWNHG